MESLIRPDTRRPRPEAAPYHTHQEHPGLLDFQEFLPHINLKSITPGPQDKRKKKIWLVNCWHTQNPLLLTSLEHDKEASPCIPSCSSAPVNQLSLVVSNSLKGCISLPSGFWASEQQPRTVGVSKLFQALAGQNTALTMWKKSRDFLYCPHSLTQNWQPRATTGHQGRRIHQLPGNTPKLCFKKHNVCGR